MIEKPTALPQNMQLLILPSVPTDPNPTIFFPTEREITSSCKQQVCKLTEIQCT